MNQILTIARKEFRDYFLSPTAAIFITVFLFLSFWIFFSQFFVAGQASLRLFFEWTPLLFLVFIPAITMGQWSEEKKMGTLEILLTLPLKDSQIVLGKFLASFSFIFISLLLTLPLPLTVSILGDLDWGPVIGGYLGLLFLGLSCVAVGLFISSLTESPIVAFIISFLVLFIFYILGENLVVSYFPDWMSSLLISISLSQHFQSIARGVVDSRDIIYYLSLTFFFIYLNVLSLESRKWDT